MKPWPFLKLKKAKPAGLRIQAGNPRQSAGSGCGFAKDGAIVRKRRVLKPSTGKMTMVIARRVGGSKISCNYRQEPTGKET
jgi:hypothetical protein